MIYPTKLKSTVEKYRGKGQGTECGGKEKQLKEARTLSERRKEWSKLASKEQSGCVG